MPRLVHKLPSYRLHKPSGQAVVTLGGRDVYLGPHNSRTSRAEYDRVVAEWLANGRQLITSPPDDATEIGAVRMRMDKQRPARLLGVFGNCTIFRRLPAGAPLNRARPSWAPRASPIPVRMLQTPLFLAS